MPRDALTAVLRVLLSVIGGVLAIGVIESAATVYSLLRFGMDSTQSVVAAAVASAIAASMFLASSLATLTVLGSAVSRYASSIQRGWYRPLLLAAIAIYAALLVLGILVDPESLHGQLLVEKRLSIGVYATLAVAAILFGALRRAGGKPKLC